MFKSLATLLLSTLLCISCNKNGKDKTFASPKGYNLSDPFIIQLRADLDEISGVQFYPKDTSIFAINDERGILFKIYPRKKVHIKTWNFSSAADYEDIVLLDSTFYVLKSSGDIDFFKVSRNKKIVTDYSKIKLEGNNEFESLYYDKDYNKLMLVCKDCAGDSKKEISVYAFDPTDNSYSSDPIFKIDAEEIADQLGKSYKKFRPSAAAINPITNELYVVSAVSNALIVADKDGNVKNAYVLNPAFFKQPEGITFTPKGDLLISNESAEIGAGNILIFKYKPLVNEKG